MCYDVEFVTIGKCKKFIPPKHHGTRLLEESQKSSDLGWFVMWLAMKAKLWNNALSHNIEESFKKFMDPELAVDYLQNLISSSLSTDLL